MITITHPMQSHRKARFLAAAGATVMLTLAFGIGLWQGLGVGTDSSDRASTSLTAVAASIPPVSSGAGTPVPVITSSQQAPRLYIVATEEAAMELHARFQAFGHTDQPYDVLVLAQAEDDGRMPALRHEPFRVREDNGLLPVDITDLR